MLILYLRLSWRDLDLDRPNGLVFFLKEKYKTIMQEPAPSIKFKILYYWWYPYGLV